MKALAGSNEHNEIPIPLDRCETFMPVVQTSNCGLIVIFYGFHTLELSRRTFNLNRTF